MTDAEPKKFAFFPGCLIPVRYPQMEAAIRKTLPRLGVEIVDLPGFTCCPDPIYFKSYDKLAWLTVAARNLAVAEEAGLEVLALCSSCASVLAEAAEELTEDDDLRARVNEKLAKVGRKVERPPRVRHFARWLYEEVGPEAIKEKVVAPLADFRFAVHYGCHYLKPSWAFHDAEDPEAPHSIGELLRATGADVVDYAEYKKCCGGALLGIDAELSLAIAGEKLTRVKAAGPDAVVLVCPFCAVMYDDNQKKVAAQLEQELELPVLFLPQVLGLALGFSAKDVGLKLAKNKCEKLLAAFAEAK